MCQRVALLPRLASVKAVYIGPEGGGGNSAQTPPNPLSTTEVNQRLHIFYCNLFPRIIWDLI